MELYAESLFDQSINMCKQNGSPVPQELTKPYIQEVKQSGSLFMCDKWLKFSSQENMAIMALCYRSEFDLFSNKSFAIKSKKK